MPVVSTSGKANLNFVKATDKVRSLEDPAHYTAANGNSNMKSGKRKTGKGKSRVRSEGKSISPRTIDAKSTRSRSTTTIDWRRRARAQSETPCPRRPQINCRYRLQDGSVSYTYRGKKYLCPPGQKPWNDKAALRYCFVEPGWSKTARCPFRRVVSRFTRAEKDNRFRDGV